MMKKVIILLFLCGWPAAQAVQAQCPPGNQLWERLSYLTKSSPLTPDQELKEFAGYGSSGRGCMPDSTYAFLLQRIGASYYKKSDFVAAIDSTRKSVSVLTRTTSRSVTENRLLIKDYYNLSVFYGALNMTTQKMRAVDSCIDVSVQTKLTDEAFLYTLTGRVDFLLNIGDFDRCYEYASTGEMLSRQYADKRAAENYIIHFLTIRISVMLVKKDHKGARQLLLKTIPEFDRKGSGLNAGGLYEKLAEVEIQAENYTAARLYFQKALKIHREARENLEYIQAMNNLGLYLYEQHMHDHRKALFVFNQALQAQSSKPDESENSEALNILTNIANVYVRCGRFDSAQHYYALAFSRIRPGMDEKDLLDISINSLIDEKNWAYLLPLVIDKGDAWLHQYRTTRNAAYLRHAIQVYKTGVRLFERIKLEYSAAGSKLFWREGSRRLYEHAIEACFASSQITDAFYFFEKSRAVLLSDELTELKQTQQKDILLQTQLKKQILQKKARLMDADPGSAAYRLLNQELFADQLKLDKLLGTIRASNPFYFQNFLDTSFVTIEDVRQRILNNHQAVVELFDGDSAVYLLALLPEKSFIKKIDKKQYEDAVGSYTAYLSSSQKQNSEGKAFRHVSHALFKLIFDGLDVPAGRIIISPDGPYFPYESLISEPLNASSYLIKRFAFSYTYSARYLMNDYAVHAASGGGTFFGMAPVHYSNEFKLATLSGSDISLQQLQHYFSDPKVFYLQEATRNNFLHNYFRYDVVQLYTHATDSGRRGEPEIFFCDSSLSLSELMPESVPVTRLIVLSACKTGIGRSYKGEGVFNFNRAFAALGIPASVTNLWNADSKATYRLINLMYKNLSAGMPADLALQKAKIAFMDSGSELERLPYYWAGTVLAGKTDSIPVTESFSWSNGWALPAMAVLLICLIYIVFRFLRKPGTKKQIHI